MRDMSCVPPVIIAAQTLYLLRCANSAVYNSAAAILIDIMLTCAFLFSKQFQYTITVAELAVIDRKRERKRRKTARVSPYFNDFLCNYDIVLFLERLFNPGISNRLSHNLDRIFIYRFFDKFGIEF